MVEASREKGERRDRNFRVLARRKARFIRLNFSLFVAIHKFPSSRKSIAEHMISDVRLVRCTYCFLDD